MTIDCNARFCSFCGLKSWLPYQLVFNYIFTRHMVLLTELREMEREPRLHGKPGVLDMRSNSWQLLRCHRDVATGCSREVVLRIQNH